MNTTTPSQQSMVDELMAQLQGAPMQQMAQQLGASGQQIQSAVGAALPLGAAVVSPLGQLALGVSVAALLFLMLLGGVGAAVGGAPVVKGVLRVAFWGVLAMAATYAIGSLFGTAVA